MNPHNILILPGWQNSGPDHWQSLWELAHGYLRVEQHDWMQPLRGDWSARLEDVLLQCDEPAVLVAHSMGCHLVSTWAACSNNTHLVKAALLVAPGDPQREELRRVLHSWLPIAKKKLPFKTVLVASRSDPYCSFERANQFATDWGSDFIDYGWQGHINAESGLGSWLYGHQILDRLQREQMVGAPIRG